MRENRTSGSEGGEAQTNELSLPLSLCRLGRCQSAPVWEDPPWSEQVRGAEAAPSALVSALEQ